MARKYTKVEALTAVIRARKAAGEANRAIGESYGLSLKQVKGLVNRQNRKERMQVELLRNFLSEAGRR